MSTPAPLDPRTAAALDRVRDELAALHEIPMPPDVADRIAAALTDTPVRAPRTAADRADATVRGRPDGRRDRGRRGFRRPAHARTAVVAAAAAGLVAAIVTLPGSGPADPAPAGIGDDLRSAGAVTFGRDGAGGLADPVRRRGCLTAAGVPEPGAALLGGRPYAVGGTPGTLLVMGTAVTGRYRLLVVDAGCGPDGGRVLAESVAGR